MEVRFGEPATYLPRERRPRSFLNRENATDLNRWIFHHSVPRHDRVMKLSKSWFTAPGTLSIDLKLLHTVICDTCEAQILYLQIFLAYRENCSRNDIWPIRFNDYDGIINNKFRAIESKNAHWFWSDSL